MTTRYTNRVLLFIVLVLLVTNVVLLFFFVFKPEKSKRVHSQPVITQDSGMAATLKDSVGFNDQQIAAYLDLRSVQRPKLKQYFSTMRRLKQEFYGMVNDAAQDSASQALADSIGIMQQTIDLHMRNYFLQIREISTPEQLPAFDKTIKKATARMIGRSGSRNRSEPAPSK